MKFIIVIASRAPILSSSKDREVWHPLKGSLSSRESYPAAARVAVFLQSERTCIEGRTGHDVFSYADVAFVSGVSLHCTRHPSGSRLRSSASEGSPYRLCGGPNNRRYPGVSKRCNHAWFFTNHAMAHDRGSQERSCRAERLSNQSTGDTNHALRFPVPAGFSRKSFAASKGTLSLRT